MMMTTMIFYSENTKLYCILYFRSFLLIDFYLVFDNTKIF